MKIIVYLIILLGVCYFLYKINSDIWNTKKTKKKSNYKNEVDAIIDETLYKHKKPINMQDKYLNADNQEESVNTNKSNEKIIQVPQSESIHKNSAIDLKTEIKNILANKPGFVKAMWCGDRECEDKLKEYAGITSRCIPFEQEHIDGKCVCCGKEAKHMLYWGKAY